MLRRPVQEARAGAGASQRRAVRLAVRGRAGPDDPAGRAGAGPALAVALPRRQLHDLPLPPARRRRALADRHVVRAVARAAGQQRGAGLPVAAARARARASRARQGYARRGMPPGNLSLLTRLNPCALDLPDADVRLWPRAFAADEADRAVRCACAHGIDWQQEEILIFGERRRVPRLVAWHGDPGTAYTYSGTAHEPLPWTRRTAVTCASASQTLTGHRFQQRAAEPLPRRSRRHGLARRRRARTRAASRRSRRCRWAPRAASSCGTDARADARLSRSTWRTATCC